MKKQKYHDAKPKSEKKAKKGKIQHPRSKRRSTKSLQLGNLQR